MNLIEKDIFFDQKNKKTKDKGIINKDGCQVGPGASERKIILFHARRVGESSR